MRYCRSHAFERRIKGYHFAERIEIQRRVDAFVRAIEARQIPAGFGLKKLRENTWEFRISLELRALFQWQKDVLTFLFIGNHKETQQFLKHFLSH